MDGCILVESDEQLWFPADTTERVGREISTGG